MIPRTNTCAFRVCPKVPYMDTENTPSLAAPCEFLEGHNFSYGRGDFHPRGFPTKIPVLYRKTNLK